MGARIPDSFVQYVDVSTSIGDLGVNLRRTREVRHVQ